MYNPYVEYIGKMDITVISPISELTPFIESYVFYENTHITNDVVFKVLSSGKVEMFIHYNDSNLFLTNGKKEIKLNDFIIGISEISNGLKIKPVSESHFFNGISITFNMKGVLQLLGISIKSLTNKIFRVESVFGEESKMLVDGISGAKNNKEREEILNSFFLMLLSKKKKYKTSINTYWLYMN